MLWGQHDGSRTYNKSKNVILSLAILLVDLDDLVNYATLRFHRPIIIVGHSWGTLLGISYAAAHSEKIIGYVGVDQFVNDIESIRLKAAAKLARDAGNEQDAEEIKKLYQAYTAHGITDVHFDINGFSRFRQLTTSYLAPGGKNIILTALLSPDFGLGDLCWELRLMTDANGLVATERLLYAACESFTPPEQLSVPAGLP